MSDDPRGGTRAGEGAAAGRVVDAIGLHCPMPVVALARAAATVDLDTELILLCDDPAANIDVPAWCRIRGQEFIGAEPWSDHDAPDRDAPDPGPAAAGPVVTAYRVRITTVARNVP